MTLNLEEKRLNKKAAQVYTHAAFSFSQFNY